MRVLPETLPYAWATVAPMLQPAVMQNHGEFDMNYTAYALDKGLWQLWTVIDCERPVAAMVTEIIQHPTMKVCHLVLLGGYEFDRWKHLLKEVEDFALLNECVALEAHVRPGMARKAATEGFELDLQIIRKSLRGRLQ